MKFRVRGAEEKPEPVVEFWLSPNDDGGIDLMAQRKPDHPRHLLMVTPDRPVGLFHGVIPELGIPLDRHACIQIEGLNDGKDADNGTDA